MSPINEGEFDPPPALPHEDEDCTGEWEPIGGKDSRAPDTWRCSRCGKEYEHTPEVARSAVWDFALGVLMRLKARTANFPPPPPRTMITIELPKDEEDEEDDLLDNQWSPP